MIFVLNCALLQSLHVLAPPASSPHTPRLELEEEMNLVRVFVSYNFDRGRFINGAGRFINDAGRFINDAGQFINDAGRFINDGGRSKKITLKMREQLVVHEIRLVSDMKRCGPPMYHL